MKSTKHFVSNVVLATKNVSLMQYLSNRKETIMDQIKLNIDNREVIVPKGTTISKLLNKSGLRFQRLCHFELKGMNIHNKPGGCRICVVEVEGKKKLSSGMCDRMY
jgi:NADP-reducing hydrogenase subunit HndD